MPSSSSSRKKNKGKDRKAKKEEAEKIKEESKRVAMYNLWKAWARDRSAGIIHAIMD